MNNAPQAPQAPGSVPQLVPQTPQANPMHPAPAPHANAGTVAIEQSRAVAEALGKIQIAKAYPRSLTEAYAAVEKSCSRKSFAEVATYAYPRGGQTITGPSIRLAEELARCFGNIQYGIRELSQRPGESEMQAFAWDVENNVERTMNFTVKHERHTKNGVTKLTDPRDIYEMTANQGGRRVRACILAVLDRDLESHALRICKQALAGSSAEPISDRIRMMVSEFSKIGIQSQHIEQWAGVKLDDILPDQIADLRSIYNSLRDGMTRPSDWFNVPAEREPSNPTIQSLNEKLLNKQQTLNQPPQPASQSIHNPQQAAGNAAPTFIPTTAQNNQELL